MSKDSLQKPAAVNSPASARRRARAIIKLYRLALEREKFAVGSIGNRRIKRKVIPPRERPASILKREIYRCGVEIERDKASSEIFAALRSRDGRMLNRGLFSSLNCAIQLVLYQPPLPKTHDLYRDVYADIDRPSLLNATAASRLKAELQFAWEHKIHWQLVDAFVGQAGGYELISAHEKQWDTPFSSFFADWIDVWPKWDVSAD